MIGRIDDFPLGIALELFSGGGEFSKQWRHSRRIPLNIPVIEADLRHVGST